MRWGEENRAVSWGKRLKALHTRSSHDSFWVENRIHPPKVDVFIKSKLFSAPRSCLYSRNHEPSARMKIKHLTMRDFSSFLKLFSSSSRCLHQRNGEKREMNNNFVNGKNFFLITRATRFARASQGFALDNWIFLFLLLAHSPLTGWI
jgi:hypothetical protein